MKNFLCFVYFIIIAQLAIHSMNANAQQLQALDVEIRYANDVPTVTTPISVEKFFDETWRNSHLTTDVESLKISASNDLILENNRIELEINGDISFSADGNIEFISETIAITSASGNINFTAGSDVILNGRGTVMSKNGVFSVAAGGEFDHGNVKAGGAADSIIESVSKNTVAETDIIKIWISYTNGRPNVILFLTAENFSAGSWQTIYLNSEVEGIEITTEGDLVLSDSGTEFNLKADEDIMIHAAGNIDFSKQEVTIVSDGGAISIEADADFVIGEESIVSTFNGGEIIVDVTGNINVNDENFQPTKENSSTIQNSFIIGELSGVDSSTDGGGVSGVAIFDGDLDFGINGGSTDGGAFGAVDIIGFGNSSTDGGTFYDINIIKSVPNFEDEIDTYIIEDFGNFVIEDGEDISNSLEGDFNSDSGVGTNYVTGYIRNDLYNVSYITMMFTPDGFEKTYRVCTATASTYPTDPADGEILNLADDDYHQIPLPERHDFTFFGKSYSSFFVGSNGYLTFENSDETFVNSIENHFDLPRISGFFADLDPSSSGTVSWKALNDRIAVTFADVPEYETANSNQFQIEMFYDGKISITYLNMDVRLGLVGLSPGLGVPDDFSVSDFSSNCMTENLGEIVVNEAIYSCEGSVIIEVQDPNMLGNSLSVLATTNEGDLETIELNDPDGDYLFSGTLIIGSVDDPVSPGDQQINPGNSGPVTLTYADRDDGKGGEVLITESFDLDCSPPVISDLIISEMGSDQFTLTFSTDEPATALVEIGRNCDSPGIVMISNEANVLHSIPFSLLSSKCTTYLRIEAIDGLGNTVMDDNNGQCYEIKTLLQTETVVFSDDFEGTNQGWTANGLWHIVNETSTFSKYRSGFHRWWYGSEKTGDYNVPEGEGNHGELRSPPIRLPANTSPLLSFNSWEETEESGIDTMTVYVDDGGILNLLHQTSLNSSSWEEVEPLDLSLFAGKEIQLVFEFDATGGSANDFRGWYIDDVEIRVIEHIDCGE